jgi:hypothetical protein
MVQIGKSTSVQPGWDAHRVQKGELTMPVMVAHYRHYFLGGSNDHFIIGT